jgi:hypothetical protein
MYAHMSLSVTNGNWLWLYTPALWSVQRFYSNSSVFAYSMLVTQGKCAEVTFIMKQFTYPVKQEKSGGSVTVLLYFWNFTCYFTQFILGNVSIFKSTLPPPSSRFIYHSFLDLKCNRLYHWPQATTQLSSRVTISGYYLSRFFYLLNCWCKVLLQINIPGSCLYSWWKLNSMMLYQIDFNA